jgi:hypothetical protein
MPIAFSSPSLHKIGNTPWRLGSERSRTAGTYHVTLVTASDINHNSEADPRINKKKLDTTNSLRGNGLPPLINGKWTLGKKFSQSGHVSIDLRIFGFWRTTNFMGPFLYKVKV